VLIALGVWQLQRLAWKEAALSQIDARISAAPVPLPARPDPIDDKYLPVQVNGTLLPAQLHVLVGAKELGAGYRLIQPFETGTRRIMVDRGFVQLEAKDTPPSVGPAQLIGTLHWPNEIDSYTPDPDTGRGIWFARDVPAMAAALKTEPVLLVVRDHCPADRHCRDFQQSPAICDDMVFTGCHLAGDDLLLDLADDTGPARP